MSRLEQHPVYGFGFLALLVVLTLTATAIVDTLI